MDHRFILPLVGLYQTGCILTDSLARVLDMNPRARQILQNGTLIVEGDRLKAGRSTESLKRMVAEAAKCGPNPSILRLEQPGRPLMLRAIGCPGRDRAVVAVLLSDLSQRPPVDAAALREFFGFTETETAIALRLMYGLSVDEAAKELGITVHTVRTHLKRIFDKAGVSRQTQLINTLLRTPLYDPHWSAPAHDTARSRTAE